MFFSGIEKNSFNDFPSKISCVIFVQGCNFFCPYCHNPETIPQKKTTMINERKILNLVKQRKKYYDGIVISGGEPTLNNDLPAFCKSIKEMGYYLKLDTNGSRPTMLSMLLKNKLVDYIAMDLKTYPSKGSHKQLTNDPLIEQSVKKSIGLIIDKAPEYEFRTTCVRPFVDRLTIKRICNLIKGAKRYILQEFNSNAFKIQNKNFFSNIEFAIPKKEIFSFFKEAKNMVEHCGINRL